MSKEPEKINYECQINWVEKKKGFYSVWAYTKEDAQERLAREIEAKGYEFLRSQSLEIQKVKYKIRKD